MKRGIALLRKIFTRLRAMACPPSIQSSPTQGRKRSNLRNTGWPTSSLALPYAYARRTAFSNDGAFSGASHSGIDSEVINRPTARSKNVGDDQQCQDPIKTQSNHNTIGEGETRRAMDGMRNMLRRGRPSVNPITRANLVIVERASTLGPAYSLL